MIGKFAAGVLCAAAAAVSSGAGAAEQGSILVIASSEKTMTLADGSSMDVGFFLNEFAVSGAVPGRQGLAHRARDPVGQGARHGPQLELRFVLRRQRGEACERREVRRLAPRDFAFRGEERRPLTASPASSCRAATRR
jgi:hypothetical protein